MRQELSSHELGRGRRLPAELKARVQAYATERRGQGATLREIGAELGAAAENVRRWSSSSESSGRKRSEVPVAVHVIADSNDKVILVSPSGYRLEGLGLEEAVQLLRALG